MTNKKIKNAQYNLQVKTTLLINAGNLMTLFLCLLEKGEGKDKIIEADEYLVNEFSPKGRKLAHDDVLDVTVDRFLNSEKLSFDEMRKIVRQKNGEKLKTAKMPLVWYEDKIIFLTEDFCMYLKLINEYFGYGKKRLVKLIEAFSAYSKNPFEEAEKEFGIVYSDNNTLHDYSNERKLKTIKVDYDTIKQMSADLKGLRAYQNYHNT